MKTEAIDILSQKYVLGHFFHHHDDHWHHHEMVNSIWGPAGGLVKSTQLNSTPSTSTHPNPPLTTTSISVHHAPGTKDTIAVAYLVNSTPSTGGHC